MIWFSLISILLIAVLWKCTVVYTTVCDNFDWIPDESSGKPLEFTYLHFIGLLLLLIPIFNIFWFLMLLGWYIKRAAYDEFNTFEDSVFWRPDKVTELFNSIYNVLNRKI